jgi:hypothetical protein
MYAYHEDQFQVIDKGPFNSVSILFVLLFGSPAFNQRFTDERINWRS